MDAPITVPQKELDLVRAKTARTMLNVTQRTVEALDKLSHRLDGIDDAIASTAKLDEMSLQELFAYFNQCKESFRLRQDFLRALAGYDVDTTKVPVEKDEATQALEVSDEDAERLKAEIARRNEG